MVTFNEFLDNKEIILEAKDSQYFVGLDIENTEVLYQKAMRTKNAGDLKDAMVAMKAKFPDAKKIDFDEVNWKEIYSDLNESADATKVIDSLNADIDKAIEDKDKKYLDILAKELDKILKNIK